MSDADLARKALDLFNDGSLRRALVNVERSAFRTLLAAFEQSGSLAEQEIVLRYQAARDRSKWDHALVERLLKLARDSATKGASDREQARSSARQLGYVVRLHRVAQEQDDGQRGGRR